MKKKKGANVAATAAAARKLLQVVYPLAEKQGRVPDRRLDVQTLVTKHAALLAYREKLIKAHIRPRTKSAIVQPLDRG